MRRFQALSVIALFVVASLRPCIALAGPVSRQHERGCEGPADVGSCEADEGRVGQAHGRECDQGDILRRRPRHHLPQRSQLRKLTTVK